MWHGLSMWPFIWAVPLLESPWRVGWGLANCPSHLRPKGLVVFIHITGNAQENAGGQAVLQLSIHSTKTFLRGAFISFISSFYLTQAGIKLTAIHLPQVLKLQT